MQGFDLILTNLRIFPVLYLQYLYLDNNIMPFFTLTQSRLERML
jgi:hypothetical protein